MTSARSYLDELQVKPASQQCFTNTQKMWSFNNWHIIPGALLMPQSVSAAHHTLPPGFHIHSVQTQFLSIGSVFTPVTYSVDKLSDGNNFATRQVKVTQGAKLIATVTAGFTKKAAVVAEQGIAVVGSIVPLKMPVDAPSDEHDHIRYIRGDRNPTIKGYPLPIIAKDSSSRAPESKLARHWLHVTGPPLSTANENMANLLALIGLSDIFLLDSAPRIYGLDFDFKDEKAPSERLKRVLKAMTTINHSIHVVNVDKVRVDEWVYVECEWPWAINGRIMLHSRMFSRDGVLLATCAQEGLLLLRKSTSDRIANQKL